MRRFLRYRPSPVTLIVGIVSSLVFAGIAYANLPGTNSVISSDIAPRAVHNSDDATGSVNSRVIRNGSVTTTDIKDGTILLADMNPATIAALKGAPGGPGGPGTPGAPGAPGAPGTTTFGAGSTTGLFFATTNAVTEATLFTVGGFHIFGSCSAGDVVTTTLQSGMDNSELTNDGFFFSFGAGDASNFDNNVKATRTNTTQDAGQFVYTETDGTVVTGNVNQDEGTGVPLGGTQDCLISGAVTVT